MNKESKHMPINHCKECRYHEKIKDEYGTLWVLCHKEEKIVREGVYTWPPFCPLKDVEEDES